MEDHGEPEGPPAPSTQLIVTTGGDKEEERTSADVELAWVGEAGRPQSLVMRDVPMDSTLAEFRQCCAAALGVESVVAQDFNEDMDSASLLALGIGSSGLAFFIDVSSPVGEAVLGEAATVDAAAACVPSSVLTLPDPPAGPVAPGRKSAGGPRTFAEKQALKDASEVKDGWLFLGGNLSAGNLAVLRELGVTHVLNCCDRVPCKFKKSLTYKVVSVTDTKAADIRKHFPGALEFIDAGHAAGGGVLVHCMVGASRSTSMVLAWLVSRCQMPLLEAFRYVRGRRSVARPNRSFCQQLIEFEEAVLGRRSATLADFGHS